MAMMRKEQGKIGTSGCNDIKAQAKLIAELFPVAA
jgi:hypothetical protein